MLWKQSRKTLNTLIYIFLGMYSLIIIYPLIFTFLASFKTNNEIFLSPWNLPDNWDFMKYIRLVTEYGMGTYFLNSVYYSITSVAITVFISSMAAYALVRMKWKLQMGVFALFILGLMVPIHSAVVPLYIMFSKAGFSNPRISLVLVYVAFSMPITLFILSGFLKGIPMEMEESAVMEGCTIFRAFFTIIMPLLNPALVTVIIFNFLTVWNDFFAGLIFINQDKHKTLQLGVTQFQGNYGMDYSQLLAAIILIILPSIVVYIVIQDKIINGITAGAVKG